MSLRKWYYSLPPRLRMWVRRVYFLPRDLFYPSDQKPPDGLIYTGSGDFLATGQKFLSLFQKEGGLSKHDHILDIGSGIGRMAIPLSQFLSPTARYEGFDVVKTGVDWCNKNISSKHKNFHFRYIDLNNDLYKSSGMDASQFVFPYRDRSFDFIIATSVFTHLTPDIVERYISEIARVLKDGKKAFLTFFLLTEQNKHKSLTNPNFCFPYNYGHYALMHAKVPSANVAYDLDYIQDLLQKSKLQIKSYNQGHWCKEKSSSSWDFQDILIVSKL